MKVSNSVNLDDVPVTSKTKYGKSKKRLLLENKYTGWVAILAKSWSNLPVLKWIIYPFFKRPINDITSIPIGLEIKGPDSVAIPRRIIKRLLANVDEKFIFDECLCRVTKNVDWPPQNIGCMAMGPGVRIIHPSHGRMVTTEEAQHHVDRAADAGLVANVAYVWIDESMFGYKLPQGTFICFCDDRNCVYRTYMKKRGPSLDGAFQKLPGLSVSVDTSKCKGCRVCVDQCFLGNISLVKGKSEIGLSCAGCGRCAERCPNKAITLTIENEEALYENLVKWIRGHSQVPIKNS